MDTKTLQLQKLIKSKLDTLSGETYHSTSPPDAGYPNKVFSLEAAPPSGGSRDNITLIIDLWDVAKNLRVLDTIADQIEALLDKANFPQGTILPTFYKGTRYQVPDENKDIKHVQMTFYIQNYERG